MRYCCSQRTPKFFAACERWMMSALSIKPNIADFSMTAKSLQPALIVNATIEFKTVQSFAERDIVQKLQDAKPDFQFEGIEPEVISMSGSCLDGTDMHVQMSSCTDESYLVGYDACGSCKVPPPTFECAKYTSLLRSKDGPTVRLRLFA